MNNKKQRGLSILELMVSLIIGLFLLWGLAKFYETGNRSAKQAAAIASLNETARQIFSFIGNDAHLAGYVDIFDGNGKDAIAKDIITGHLNAFSRLPKTGTTDDYEVPFMLAAAALNPKSSTWGNIPPVFGCNGDFANKGIITTPSCDSKPANNPTQSVQFAYQAIGSSLSTRETKSLRGAAGESNTGRAMGCDGNDIPDPHGLVINRYFLDKDVFKCQSSASEGQRSHLYELVKGVEEMMIHYGITTAGTEKNNKSSLVVDKYISANDILNKTVNPMGYAGIVSIDLCIVLKAEGDDGAKIDASAQTVIPSCTGVKKARQKGDRALYRLYRSTFALQNLIYTE